MYLLPSKEQIVEAYMDFRGKKGLIDAMETEIEDFIEKKLSLQIWIYTIVNPSCQIDAVKFEVFSRGTGFFGSLKVYSYDQVVDIDLFLMCIARDLLFS